MCVDEVGVDGSILECLKGVSHSSWHVDGTGRIKHAGEYATERLPRTQVNPRTEDRTSSNRDELVPGLSVDTTRNAALGVEGDVVLNGAELGGQASNRHLYALPVLLKPATRIAVHR